MILCEDCYKAPASYFMIDAHKLFHKHPIHLNFINEDESWEWNINGDSCMNKIDNREIYDNGKVSYRCDMWEYNACTNWTIKLFEKM